MSYDRHAARAFVELRFGPKWTYISTVRTFIQNFLAITLEDKIKADKVSMAVSELVENAVKYSNQEDTFLRLEEPPDRNSIEVVVSNNAAEEQAQQLLGFVTEMEKLPPLEAYMQMMRLSAERQDGKSQLGLARIRYEASATLNVTYENGLVTIRANFSLG